MAEVCRRYTLYGLVKKERIETQETKRVMKGILQEYRAKAEEINARLPIHEKDLQNILMSQKLDSVTKLYRYCQSKSEAARRLFDRKAQKVD